VVKGFQFGKLVENVLETCCTVNDVTKIASTNCTCLRPTIQYMLYIVHTTTYTDVQKISAVAIKRVQLHRTRWIEALVARGNKTSRERVPKQANNR
jgi:hypothetical protein